MKDLADHLHVLYDAHLAGDTAAQALLGTTLAQKLGVAEVGADAHGSLVQPESIASPRPGHRRGGTMRLRETGSRGVAFGCLLLASLACGGSLPSESPAPPAPGAPARAVQPEAFDALAWWKALPPCIQEDLLQATKAPPPTDAAGVAPMLAVTAVRVYPSCSPKMESIEWIRPLVRLEELMINDQPVRDLSPLGALVHLEELDVYDWQLPAWPQDLTLPALRELSVKAPLPDLSFLGRHPKLVKLRLEGAKKASLEPLRGLALEELALDNMNTSDLSPISSMKSLQTLYLSSYEQPPADLASLAGLTGLRELSASYHRGGSVDLTPLVGLPLVALSLQGCKLQSLERLSQIKTLQSLDLSDSNLDSLAPLEGLPLTELFISETPVPAEEIAAFRAAHPEVTVYDEHPGD